MDLKTRLKSSGLRFGVYIFLAQGIFMLSNLYVNHYIEGLWGVDGFAAYNLIKRIGSFIVFPLILGTGIGIPRFISFIKTDHYNSSVEYLLSGLIIFFSAFLAFSLAVLLFPSFLLSGFEALHVSRNTIVITVLLFVFGQGVYVALNAYFRGRLQIGWMTSVNIIIMSAFPMLMLYFAANVFDYVINYSLWIIMISLLIIARLSLRRRLRKKVVRLKTIRLFKYGYPRMAGDIGLFALEFLPVFLVSSFIGLKQSGYIAISLILLKLASAVYEMAGALILPYFGKLFRQVPYETFIKKVNLLTAVGFIASVLIAVIFYLLIPFVITNFFSSLQAAIKPSQYLFIGFPFYSVYLLLRNVLDIVEERAYNSINLVVTFTVQLIIIAIGIYLKSSIVYSVFALIVPYLILGGLSYIIWVNLSKRLMRTRSV